METIVIIGLVVLFGFIFYKGYLMLKKPTSNPGGGSIKGGDTEDTDNGNGEPNDLTRK